MLAGLALGLSNRWLSVPLLGLGWFATGVSLSTLHARSEVPAVANGSHDLEGEVEAVDVRAGRTRLELAVARVDGAPVRARARLYPGGALRPLLPGQRVRVRSTLKPLDGRANPGEASAFERHQRRALIYSGSFDPRGLLVLSPPAAAAVAVEARRQGLAKAAERLAPSADAAHLYVALAAGLRADLGDAVEDEFARSGLAHVLSVSGLHVAALGVAARALVRWLWVLLPVRRLRRPDARTAALPFALAAVWGYTLFTGSQVPALRSAIMTTLLFGAAALLRRSDPLNALCFAGLVLLTLQPFAVADLSAQLSVLSAAALILLAPRVRDALPVPRPDPSREAGWRLWVARAREAAVVTLCASVAVVVTTAPLIASAFERLSLMGLVSNVVCLPLCTGAAVLAATGAGLFWVSAVLATPVVWLGAWSCELLLVSSRLFAALPLSTLSVTAPPPWAIAAWLAGLAGLGVLPGRGRALGATAMAAALALWVAPRLEPRAGVEVTFLAVGHGDAIVVSSNGRHALVDGGGSPGGADTGARFVLPYFKRRRIESLEVAALSHAHPDHALGLSSVMKVVPTRRLWLPAGVGRGPLVSALLDAKPSEVTEVEAGASPFTLGEARITVLGPPRDRILLEGENDRSVVLQIDHGEVSFLLTGDLEAAGEEALEAGPVTVLKAPHHGSRTSSSDGLIERARPRFAVFCVGKGNRFGFPHGEVVARYEAAGARCYRTDLDGAITFRSDGHDVQVETFRQEGEVWRAARRVPAR
ncbi:MAG: DNA internalization-related competence protein ComEC/Rec2 [Myxococcaceae bacterium]|nr:DNA internalization-related competence protein ComEC/Rec2 [Myxococcaceae bacterium]